MCGIAGIVNFDRRPADEDVLLRMREAMLHRGPDDAGIWTGPGIGLAQRRLSIFDLSPLGHQPMASQDGESWMVFNGEIFNFPEIKRDLEAQGHRFRSASDTEVLLRAYQERGDRCLDDVVGMYAFAIWDGRTRSLFAARDRAGIKPFHYATVPGGFIFSSEIKALLAHPAVKAHIEPRALAEYFYAGYALGDQTLFAGIKQLPPGHMLRVKDGEVTVRPYWELEYRYDRARDHATTARELEALMEDSLRVHCRSDAPLGSHLSGGLDSSSVATLARAHRDPLETFSIKLGDHALFDETRFARDVATRIGSQHHEEAAAEDDLAELVPMLAWHMDFPMRAGGFAYFSGARLARRHVTVSLTGHGGDEIFGGYPAQFDVAFGGGGNTNVVAKTAGRASLPVRALRLVRSEGVGGLIDRVRRRAPGTKVTPEDRWVALHCDRPEPASDLRLAESFRKSLGGYSPRETFLKDFTDAPTDELFDRCLHHDLRSYLPSLLHVEDRASMAVSLESRVPLLDHRLIEFMATVPPSIKVPNRESKELLRTAMAGRLPESVMARRDKAGFPVPVDAWFRGPLAGLAAEVTVSPRSLDRGIFSPDWLRRVATDGNGEERWSALMVELWARLFIDGDPDLNARARATSARVRRGLGFSA